MKIQSMTGYGEASARFGGLAFVCRARSVNHRHLDVKLRLPRPDLITLDLSVRKRAAELFKRGSLEIGIFAETSREAAAPAALNARVAESYVKQARALGKKLKLAPSGLSLDGLLRLPGVVDLAGGNGHDSAGALEGVADAQLLSELVEPALERLNSARESEGAKLRAVIDGHLREMAGHVSAIAALEAPEKERARALMVERAGETLRVLAGAAAGDSARANTAQFEARLREEAVFWVERRDFAEERARLSIHLDEFGRLLAKEPSGRKLEFLVQEILREINTLGTKAQAPAITAHTIELKTILERIREQLANVE